MERSTWLKTNVKFLTIMVLVCLWALLRFVDAHARIGVNTWDANPEQQPPQAQLFQDTPVSGSEGEVSLSNRGVTLWGPLVLVSLAGMFGGLLYGIKEHSLMLPHRKSKHTIHPGFLTDILFGIGGGLIIYMIMPGSFNYEAGGFELIKIIAVSMLGGYGGRALVERVLASQVKELELQMQQMQDEKFADALLVKLVNRHLDDDPDTLPVDVEELKQPILAASNTGREEAFDKARTYRKKVTSEGKWDQLNRVIPIFDALVESDVDEEEARFHAQLGFTLKDSQINQETPQLDMYRRAKSELDKAIEIRNRLKQEEKWVYEFARAMTNIELNADPEQIRKDLEKACKDNDIAIRIRKPEEPLGKPLIGWLRSRQSDLQQWIESMGIDLPVEGKE